MFKSISYNVSYSKVGKYDAEKEALHMFNASNNDNMRLEYDSVHEVLNAIQCIKRYIKAAKMPLIAVSNGKGVIVMRANK